jgi:hypothetical protein
MPTCLWDRLNDDLRNLCGCFYLPLLGLLASPAARPFLALPLGFGHRRPLFLQFFQEESVFVVQLCDKVPSL